MMPETWEPSLPSSSPLHAPGSGDCYVWAVPCPEHLSSVVKQHLALSAPTALVHAWQSLEHVQPEPDNFSALTFNKVTLSWMHFLVSQTRSNPLDGTS